MPPLKKQVSSLKTLFDQKTRKSVFFRKKKDTKKCSRLGHLNFVEIENMLRSEAVNGLKIRGLLEHTYDQRTSAFNPLGPVWPHGSYTVDGANYNLTFIDDFSRLSYAYCIRNKNDAINMFTQFKNLVEYQTGYKIKLFQSDNGGEFYNNMMMEICKKAGIHHRQTVPHTPQRNGIAERRNRTLVEATRCMMLKSGLSPLL